MKSHKNSRKIAIWKILDLVAFWKQIYNDLLAAF